MSTTVQKIGKYEYDEEPFYEGKDCSIFKGKNTETYETVAIKRIPILSSNATEQEEAINNDFNLRYLMGESKYYVKFYDLLKDDQYFYIVMEYCEENLERYLNNPLKKEEFSKAVAELNEAFNEIQSCNVIHGNIKPENIFIVDCNGRSQIKFSDAGYSKQLKENPTNIYKAPEVLKNNEYSNKADSWALGMILYKLLKNKLPFANDEEYQNFLDQESPSEVPLEEIDDPDVKENIEKLLKVNPNERLSYQDYLKTPYFTSPERERYVIEKYPSGNCYEGFSKNGKKEGKGTFIYVNGDKYEGDYKDGKRSGQGIYYYANGNRYEGKYVDKKKQGKGIFFYKSGDRYEGDFEDGKFQGNGIYYFANGNRYEGEFNDDKIEGRGTKYYDDGSKKFGEWRNNECVKKF